MEELIVAYWMLFDRRRYGIFYYWVNTGVQRKYAVEKVLKEN